MSRLGRYVLAAVLAGPFAPPGTDAADSVPARVTLRSGAVRDLDILPARTSDPLLRAAITGTASRISYDLGDLDVIEFRFGPALDAARRADASGDAAAAAELYGEQLMPFLRYLSVSNNLREDVEALLFYQFAAGDTESLRRAIRRLDTAWHEDDDRTLLRFYEALNLALDGQTEQAGALLDAGDPPAASSDLYPPYAYALSLIRVAEGAWMDGLLELTRLSTLHYTDQRWMPLALYRSARIYWKQKNREAVDSIQQQMKLAYPDHPVTERTLRIPDDFPYPDVKNPGFEQPGDGSPTALPAPWQENGAAPPGAVRVIAAPDVDNGRAPDGDAVLAVTVSPIRPPVEITQTLDGFQPGQQYFVVLHENASARQGVDASGPFLEVRVDDRVILPNHLVKPVQGPGRHAIPFRRITSESFVSLSNRHTLVLSVQPGIGANDRPRTVYLDQIQVRDWEVYREQ